MFSHVLLIIFFFLSIRRPPRSTRTDTLFPTRRSSDLFKGSFVALITPFRKGKVDEKAFGDFVEWQIAQGTHGLVPVGTTGESPTLSHDEHKRVVEICIEAAHGRVPVMAGAGSNSTAEAIALTRHAPEAGADAPLIRPEEHTSELQSLMRISSAVFCL